MRNHNRPRPHTTTTNRTHRRAPKAHHGSVRQPRAELISEAVVASYIHHISQRHRRNSLEVSRLPRLGA